MRKRERRGVQEGIIYGKVFKKKKRKKGKEEVIYVKS